MICCLKFYQGRKVEYKHKNKQYLNVKVLIYEDIFWF